MGSVVDFYKVVKKYHEYAIAFIVLGAEILKKTNCYFYSQLETVHLYPYSWHCTHSTNLLSIESFKQNHGVARKIPATADASLLLEGFYEEVASPLLYDIEFRYSDGIEPQSLSEISFANYFNGSELVVVGKLLPNLRDNILESTVYAKTATENLRLTSSGNIRVG